MTKYKKNLFLLLIVSICIIGFYSCSAPMPENECLIQYRNGYRLNSSIQLDGTLYYTNNDGIFNQENQLILHTETKPLLFIRNDKIYVAIGTTITEYDKEFKKHLEFELPMEARSFAVSENSLFFTNSEHVPFIVDKENFKAIKESKPSTTVSISDMSKPMIVQYYPDYTIVTDAESGVTAFDTKAQNICVADLPENPVQIFSVTDSRVLYTTPYLLTSLRLFGYSFANPEQIQTIKPSDCLPNLEQFVCDDNIIIMTGTEFEDVSPYSNEDLRRHRTDYYCRIDSDSMQIIWQKTTKRYERILYADADHFVVLHGDELRTCSAKNGKIEGKQKTDLFERGGNFTYETGDGVIYIFDNVSNQIVGIFSV